MNHFSHTSPTERSTGWQRVLCCICSIKGNTVPVWVLDAQMDGTTWCLILFLLTTLSAAGVNDKWKLPQPILYTITGHRHTRLHTSSQTLMSVMLHRSLGIYLSPTFASPCSCLSLSLFADYNKAFYQLNHIYLLLVESVCHLVLNVVVMGEARRRAVTYPWCERHLSHAEKQAKLISSSHPLHHLSLPSTLCFSALLVLFSSLGDLDMSQLMKHSLSANIISLWQQHHIPLSSCPSWFSVLMSFRLFHAFGDLTISMLLFFHPRLYCLYCSVL